MRAKEARLYPEIMKGSRYAFLKNPENLTEKLDEILTRLCKNHWIGILAWFDSQLSNGFVKAVNGSSRRPKGEPVGIAPPRT